MLISIKPSQVSGNAFKDETHTKHLEINIFSLYSLCLMIIFFFVQVMILKSQFSCSKIRI